jgi:hypothetical protein
MKRLILIMIMIALPGAAFGLEQSFTQQGLKATIKLSPEKIEQNTKVQLSLRLEQDGTSIADKDVQLAVYKSSSDQPIISRSVDRLDNEYVDSWQFEQAGDYRVVVKIVNPQKPDEPMQYEINASVPEAGNDHGFMSHHAGGKWGWWGPGMMLLIMVPMMLLVL